MEAKDTVMKFRKKPVVIEAVQFWLSNYQLLWDFMGKPPKIDTEKRALYIRTLENKAGEQVADEGDWIIKGVKGEFYPCKPDIFEQTYELASKDTESLLKEQWKQEGRKEERERIKILNKGDERCQTKLSGGGRC